jgi:hypothetical protein
MAKVPPTFNVAWFVEHSSLCNDSEDVLSLTSANVSIKDINNFFGPKFNKNDWKYGNHPYAKIVKLVEKTYFFVIGKNKVCNKQLKVSIAKAIVVKSKGKHVNWELLVLTS